MNESPDQDRLGGGFGPGFAAEMLSTHTFVFI